MTYRPKIILADDEPLNRELYSKVFTDAGYEYYSASNGAETLQLIREKNPDLLLLDIMLQNESGLDILKQIKQNPVYQYIIIVMITSRLTSSEDQSYGLEIGADGYITKPVKNRELLARIDAFLRHKQLTDQLRKSEERFRKIIERNPDAILIIDKDGMVKFANPAAENLFQITMNDLLCRTFGYPLIKGEHTEINIVRTNNDYTTAQMRTIDIEWDDDAYYLTSIRDISDLKKKEEQLRESRENLRITLESIGDAVITTDTDSRILTMNPVAQKLTGWPIDEASGEPLDDVLNIVHGKTDNKVNNPVFDAISNGVIISIPAHTVLKSRDGRQYHIKDTAALMYNDEKKLTGVVIVFRDVTDEYIMQHKIINSEIRFRNLFEQAGDGLLVLDGDGNIVDVNIALCTLFGYTNEEICSLSLLDMLSLNRNAPDTADTILAKLTSNDFVRFETDFKTRAGTVLHCDVTATLITVDNQKLYYAVFRDMTQYKKAEEQIEKDLKEKEVLIRELHHRTKNNMQVISSMINLKQYFLKDEALKQILNELNDKILTMALVHQKLYESNDLSSINLNDYLNDLTGLIQESYISRDKDVIIEYYGVHVHTVIDIAIPLGLIVTEILINSIKHAFPDDTGRSTIEVKQTDKDTLEICISDNGTGLPDDFDMKENANLGLTTAIHLVEQQLHGTITAHSDNGAVFIIRIPNSAKRSNVS